MMATVSMTHLARRSSTTGSSTTSQMLVTATSGPDWLRIEPAPLHGATIETYDDHRIAMAFALAGLRVPGVAIRDPGCVSKTWPNYFDALERL